MPQTYQPWDKKQRIYLEQPKGKSTSLKREIDLKGWVTFVVSPQRRKSQRVNYGLVESFM